MPWARLSRSAVGFGCCTDDLNWDRTFSRRFAAATSGLSPLLPEATSNASACSAGVWRCSAGAGRPGAGRPPGTGMMTVRSRPRSANGPSGTAHRPELELESGELARDMHRERPRLLGHFPEVSASIQLEVEKFRVIGDLRRRDGQAAQRDAREIEIDQIPDALDRTDLDECRQTGLKPLGLELRLGGEHEPRGFNQDTVLVPLAPSTHIGAATELNHSWGSSRSRDDRRSQRSTEVHRRTLFRAA